MIDVFHGEFSVSPVPLEMAANYCSHRCLYCFANLNKPDRAFDVAGTARLLSNYQERKSLNAQLMQQGYPVLVSNRVDPFAMSNYQQVVPILNQMKECGIPMAFQTRGGRGIDDVLAGLPPSAWYISVAHFDDDMRRRVEPGAPTIASRFELIEKLARAGHHVALGLNPLVPEWLPNPEAVIHEAFNRGAAAMWVETLHLNHDQQKNLKPEERDAIGEDLLLRARAKSASAEENFLFMHARETAKSLGMAVFSVQQPERSDYMEKYRRLYPKTFGCTQDFINWCWDNDMDGRLVSFDDYWKVVGRSMPEGVLPIDGYIRSRTYWLLETHDVPRKMTYQQLMSIIWAEPRISWSPSNLECFGVAAERIGDELVTLVDDNDLPYLVFNRNGMADWFVEVEDVGATAPA